VLVPFVFSEETGRKVRPVLVISSAGYNRNRQDLIVAAVTSNIRRRLFGDYMMADWRGAGLLFPSIVTGILRTIKQTMVERRLGRMADTEMPAFERLLRRALAL
jgi:mRNA-degrading endonuclease toxin of MazEF toxin-antitoxin module